MQYLRYSVMVMVALVGVQEVGLGKDTQQQACPVQMASLPELQKQESQTTSGATSKEGEEVRLRSPKKLINKSMVQLNNVLKVLTMGGVPIGGKVAASMKSASDRAVHVLKLLRKNAGETLPTIILLPEEVRHIAFILIPVKDFFTQIRTAGDMIVPLVKESLDYKSIETSYLITYFALKEDIDIQTYLEKVITTRGLLIEFCREMATFCGDIQASFSEDILKLQRAFDEQKKKNGKAIAK